MNVDKPVRNTIWHIEFERTSVKEPIKVPLAAFARHKKDLLTILRNAYDRGSKFKPDLNPKPFDADKSWNDLTSLARLHFKLVYFWKPRIEQQAVHPAQRIERLRDLAKALGRARLMADKAMQDEVGNDLFKAWLSGTNIAPASVLNDRGSSAVRVADAMKKVVESLATLETAARKAALNVNVKRGPPKGKSVLPPDRINGLARVYRNSTGLKPRAGEGSFGKLVHEFLKSISGGHDVSDLDYVVEMIKGARTQVRKDPGQWGLSHFEDWPPKGEGSSKNS